MRMWLFSIALLGTSLTTQTFAQTAPTAGEYYIQLQKESMASSFHDKTFGSGGRNIGGSVWRTGNTYEISDRRSAGEPQDLQVFEPLKQRLPQFLQDAVSIPEDGLSPGVNSIPQYMADQGTYGKNREDVAGRLPMFTPESILADWNGMWLLVGHAQSKDIWGGSVVRFANQVTYRAPNECQRGCTFSMLDNPMAVAGRIQTIRKYWEEAHALPLNGDMVGVADDPWARPMKPMQADNALIQSLQLDTGSKYNLPISRDKVNPLSSWAK